MDEVLDRVNSILEKSSKAGEKQLANGTRLVEPAPQIAPKAWRHVVFAALDLERIHEIELERHQRLPQQLENFFRAFNGISMFGNELNIWGKRLNYIRIGDDIWQPFDIVRHNVPSERPNHSPYTVVYFGSTDRGQKWVFFNSVDESIGKTCRHKFHSEGSWPDFDSWLRDELQHYDSLS